MDRATLEAFKDELEKIALSPAVEAAGALAGVARRAAKSGTHLSEFPVHKQLSTFAGKALAGEHVEPGTIPRLYARAVEATRGKNLTNVVAPSAPRMG